MKKRIIQLILAILCISLTITHAVAQEGKIVRIRFHSPSLENNLFNDSADRDVTIYLPPSYDVDTNMRYPVVYLLHGYTGNDMLWTGGSYISNGNIKDWMKVWLKEGKVKEMILVMPNSYNTCRGSYYTNSIVAGNWADYIAKDLVQYIDSHYRTLPQRESRAVAGHSMGGYGSLKLGMQYHEVFGSIGSMAGIWNTDDYSYDFAIASTITNWTEFYSASVAIQDCLAQSVAFTPNASKAPFYCDFPFVYTNTQPKEIIKNKEAYDKFMLHDIFSLLNNSHHILKGMKAIYIDNGLNDNFVPVTGARQFHEMLNNLNIEHIYKEFAGDHTCCVMNSTGDALEVFSKAMAFEMLTSVEPKTKLATTWGAIRRTR